MTNSDTDYQHNADLFAALGELLKVRRRVEEIRPHPATPQEFYAALRARSPELPELPRRSRSGGNAGLAAEAAWPDSCMEWVDIALMAYDAAFAAQDAGDSQGATFHFAEGAYATMQATACMKLGY